MFIDFNRKRNEAEAEVTAVLGNGRNELKQLQETEKNKFLNPFTPAKLSKTNSTT